MKNQKDTMGYNNPLNTNENHGNEIPGGTQYFTTAVAMKYVGLKLTAFKNAIRAGRLIPSGGSGRSKHLFTLEVLDYFVLTNGGKNV